MAEKEKIFASKIKSTGFFQFKDFYQFCYDWLTDETNLTVIEDRYSEKLSGNEKDIKIEWTGIRKITDYFKYEVKVLFRIMGMTEVEVKKGDIKIKINKGIVEVKVQGILIRDWQGKFERTGIRKFLRAIYEKWVIPARVEQFEDKLIEDLDEFLNQAKAYLELEAKRGITRADLA